MYISRYKKLLGAKDKHIVLLKELEDHLNEVVSYAFKYIKHTPKNLYVYIGYEGMDSDSWKNIVDETDISFSIGIQHHCNTTMNYDCPVTYHSLTAWLTESFMFDPEKSCSKDWKAKLEKLIDEDSEREVEQFRYDLKECKNNTTKRNTTNKTKVEIRERRQLAKLKQKYESK